MRTVEKTLTILEAFLDHREEEIGITRLVELTGLNVSTIHRIASVLVKKGYLSQGHRRAKYSLGPKFLQFGGIATSRMKIRDTALPFLVGLNRVVNESVNLAVIESGEAVYAHCIEPLEPGYKLRIFTQVGARVPLYCTGVGKVFLAYMSETERERYLSSATFPQHTAKTITDRARLGSELSTVKGHGFAVDDEEMELGVRCLAAPICDFKGDVVAAVSVSGPSTRLTDDKMPDLERLLKHCASDISVAAGYLGQDNQNGAVVRTGGANTKK
jgi:IclR family KDG regulon transcriptional repressor